MRRAVLLFIFGLLLADHALALSGNQWRKLSSASQQAYVMGVLDAWMHGI